MSIENRYLKPLPWIVVGVIVAVVLLYIGDVIASASSDSAFGLGPQDEFGTAGWATWVIVGAVLIYGLYVWAVDQPIWTIGTREVVYMALGAALYGVSSWLFNTVPVPAVGNVALRPVVVIPVFFGYAFGPVVGFFTGFMGNVLGDALTGWGVFPTWDIGNGLMGLIPGLIWMSKDKSRSMTVLGWIMVVLLAIATVLLLMSPGFTNPDTGEALDQSSLWWVPALGVVLILVTNYAPQLWPILLGLLTIGFLAMGVVNLGSDDGAGGAIVLIVIGIIVGALTWLVASRREAITEALADEDTTTIVIWGTLGIIVGIGFAAASEIAFSGYTLLVAVVGSFLPAAGPNILFAVLLTPLLFNAWKQAQAQTGRYALP
jgi:hypothetical protein